MQPNLTDQLLPLFNRGLRLHRQNQTITHLGDRSQYIGMSDIAKGMECLRAAVAGKLAFTESAPNLKTEVDIAASLSKELKMQCGHWFEAGVKQVFESLGLPFLHQLEIQTVHQNIPINAHLDFVLLHPDSPNQVHIVEVKSCQNMPDTMYSSYEMQLMGQLGLLHNLWDEPCFNLRDQTGTYLYRNLSFPLLVKNALAVELPTSINQVVLQGSILMLSMNEARAIGSYEANTIITESCLKLAKQIWSNAKLVKDNKIALNQIPCAHGYHPLCDWCDYNAACSHFDGSAAPELEYDLLLLRELKAQKDAVQCHIKELEERLKNAFQNIGSGGDWVSAQTMRMRVVNCQRNNNVHQRLYLSPINRS